MLQSSGLLRNFTKADFHPAVKEKSFGGSPQVVENRKKKWCGLEASETIPPLSVNGGACLTASDKAESLNTVFTQQCSAPAAESTCSRALPEVENRSRCDRFTFTALTTKDVFGRLSKLKREEGTRR